MRPAEKQGDRSPAVSVLLIVSGLLLASLAPGGPVETRDFSHIHPVVLGGFNVYLTVLGLGSLLLGGLALKRAIHPAWPVWAGLSYVAVYGADLAGVFPVSPTPMNQALWSIEVAGTILALPTVVLGVVSWRAGVRWRATRTLPFTAWLLMALAGVAIVAFTTLAAMGH